jgi:hypothetical protein
VRNTEKMFELIDDIKEIFENINFYIPIYFDAGAETGDIKFFKEYKISTERAGREVITNIKNSARPQSSSKRRKLIRL